MINFFFQKRDVDDLQPVPEQEPPPSLRGGEAVSAHPRPAHLPPGLRGSGRRLLGPLLPHRNQRHNAEFNYFVT